MPQNVASQQQSAKHLAARAAMAYRAGFPIALLSLLVVASAPAICRISPCAICL